MSRCVVNVATGRYVRGQARLRGMVNESEFLGWMGQVPPGSPEHSDVPYAFKAFALKAAADAGHTTLLWCDACIVPIRNLDPLWERIERDGYWISNNGFTNYEWTADSAYEDLFAPEIQQHPRPYRGLFREREVNQQISHVVATAFGLSFTHPIGKAIFDEYFRLASETRAFCGPWNNTPETPCGSSDVRGHRHDQAALSVLAWRNGCILTNPPAIFAYRDGDNAPAESTLLLADGRY